jgi:Amt family ammonium transporter
MTLGYGFNPGSALVLANASSQGAVASVAAANTSLAAAAGAISGMLIQLYVQERRTGESHYDLTAAMNGCLGGLVAVTASCAVIEYWAALVIGAVAGGLYLLGSATLVKLKLDDAVDAVPVHLVNGSWGLLATGLLASPGRCQDAFGPSFTHAGLFYTLKDGVDFTLLLCQFVELVFIAGWVAATMYPFFLWLNYMGWFRSDSLEELVGLDISYHGGHQYEEEMVHEEFIKAYMDKKGLRRRRPAATRRNDTDLVDDEIDADSVSWAGFDAASPEQTGSVSRSSKKSLPPESHPISGRSKRKDSRINA